MAKIFPFILEAKYKTQFVTQYIDAAGFTELFKVLDMEVNHTLITALVEQWHPETHTFHLPHGEMGITLQGIKVMLGIAVDGLPITGRQT